jgi:hypothetical protein
MNNIDYTFTSSVIPDVMNALYNESASKDITLEEIRDAFRVKQIISKQWLLNNVQQHVRDKKSKFLVIGSWLGFTSLCLHKLGFENITEIDIDGRLEEFSKHLNRFNPDFKHITADVNSIDTSDYDVIVNTSCEHIFDNTWFKTAKDTSIMFLQSNNLEGFDDHVNTCVDLDDMISKYPLNIVYKEYLDFGAWNRFMLVGTKV